MVIGREWIYIWTGFLPHNLPIISCHLFLMSFLFMFYTIQTSRPCVLHCVWYIMLPAALPTRLILRCEILHWPVF